MKHRYPALAFVILISFAPVAARSQMANEPKLTVMDPLKGSAETLLSVADIQKLGSTVVKTTTPWHNGVQTFEGASLEQLAKSAGIQGTTLLVRALNNCTAEIPFTDLANLSVILAYKRNGAVSHLKCTTEFR